MPNKLWLPPKKASMPLYKPSPDVFEAGFVERYKAACPEDVVLDTDSLHLPNLGVVRLAVWLRNPPYTEEVHSFRVRAVGVLPRSVLFRGADKERIMGPDWVMYMMGNIAAPLALCGIRSPEDIVKAMAPNAIDFGSPTRQVIERATVRRIEALLGTGYGPSGRVGQAARIQQAYRPPEDETSRIPMYEAIREAYENHQHQAAG